MNDCKPNFIIFINLDEFCDFLNQITNEHFNEIFKIIGIDLLLHILLEEIIFEEDFFSDYTESIEGVSDIIDNILKSSYIIGQLEGVISECRYEFYQLLIRYISSDDLLYMRDEATASLEYDCITQTCAIRVSVD